MTLYSSNLKKIEIEITTMCNLKCYNCDRSCRHASSYERISIEQITKFVTESLENKWDWELISILGGEPTLHPDLLKIIDVIKKYKYKNWNCDVKIMSNGFGPYVKETLELIPDWVSIRNTEKINNINTFRSYNMAPIDISGFNEKTKFENGCIIPEECGIALTRYGFYPCGAGASVDRVFGFDLGIKALSSITELGLRNQRSKLCRICGHFKYMQPNSQNISFNWIKEEIISPSWEKAYCEYKKKVPLLSLY